MQRIQLALNVTDLDAAIDFYRAVFAVEPAKVRDGYANFAIAEPPLKLVLIEGAGGGSLNHLGVEVDHSDEVSAAASRLASAGLPIDERVGEACCYARQDKVWVHDPDGAPWEVYTVSEDVERMAPSAPIPAATDATDAAIPACC